MNEASCVAATVFVCTSCRRRIGEGEGDDAFDRPGAGLAAELGARLGDADGIRVVAVECLAVCKRPCTVAITGSGKWTYLIGDLDAQLHVAEIEAGVRSYAASSNGIVAWRERPQTFRKGVIARVPPADFPKAEAAE